MFGNDLIKVLVVDDAYRIREDIKASLDWKDLGFDIVGEASNGKQGIEKNRRLSPDLIITDIKMPVMDGLEMITELSSHKECPEFILLTAYEDFEYARKAIKLDVSNYILKHEIDEVIFRNTLIKIRDQILNKKKQKFETNNKKIKDILLEREKNEGINSFLDIVNVVELEYSFIISHFNGGAKFSLGLIHTYIKNAIKEFSDHVNIICMFDNDPFYTICVSGKNSKNLGHLCVKMANNIIMNDLESNKLKSVTISRSESNPQKFLLSFKETVDAANSDFFLEPSKKIIFAWDCCIKQYDEDNIKRIIGLMNDSLQIGDIQKTGNYLDLLNKICYENRNYECFKFIEENLEAIFKKHIDTQYERNTDASNANEFFSQTKKTAKEFYNHRDSVSPKIMEALKYVHSHLEENVSLGDISSLIDVSVVYAGQLFKKEMGIAFSKYLTQIRIEKAKSLLKTSNYKIYEISEMVGYKTVQYFSNIFKKMTGVNPSDYC